MNTLRTLITLGVAVLLCLTAATALADDTDCRAVVRLISGEQMKVRDFAVRLLEASPPDTQMMVFFDDGQSVLDLRKIRSMTRLSPRGIAYKGEKVEFAFTATDGSKGKFKIWAGYIFSGRIDMGDWSERAGRIKSFEAHCPTPDLTPPAPRD